MEAAEDAPQFEVRTRGRRRTRAPLAECNRNMAQDRSRSPIKFSGKAGGDKELPKTPNKDACSDVTVEDFETSPISSYMSTEASDTEHEADSFCRKIKARFTDSGEPMDYSVPRPSDPIVLGSSFLQKNPEFSFAESDQFTASTPKVANTPAVQLYYAETDAVTIAPADEKCELDSGLGTSIESPQSRRPSEGSVLQLALEGIFDEQEKHGEESEEEKNEETATDDEESYVVDVIEQPEQNNNAVVIINDQNEEAQAPAVDVPDPVINILPPERPEREAPAPLLDNVQWYYKRPTMTVREALADAGVCATEALMDELRFRPNIYHQRGHSWHSRNRMSAGGIREVLLRLGVDDSSTEAYRKIFNNLQAFSGTYIFLRHSLDHGDFPPELQYLQEEAERLRYRSYYNPERTQCLDINKDFNDVLLQRAVRAARQFGALAQKMAESDRMEKLAPMNGNTNAE